MGGGPGQIRVAGELCAGNALAGAFAARRGAERCGCEGLAGQGMVRDVGDEVDVEGAEDGDVGVVRRHDDGAGAPCFPQMWMYFCQTIRACVFQ